MLITKRWVSGSELGNSLFGFGILISLFLVKQYEQSFDEYRNRVKSQHHIQIVVVLYDLRSTRLKTTVVSFS